MRGKRVKYITDPNLITYDSFVVEDVGEVEKLGSDHAFGSIDVLGPANISSLKAAMKAVYRNYPYDEPDQRFVDRPLVRVTWTLESATNIDYDLSLPEPVSLILMTDDSLLVELDIMTGPLVETENETWPEGQAVLETWLASRRVELASLTPYDDGYQQYWVARLLAPLRNRTLLDVHNLGTDALAIIDAYGAGRLTIESITGLLSGGHAAALIGMPEDQLLEAKRAVQLQDDKDKLELAKDISAMANARSGGVLVIGLGTKKRMGADVIASLHPSRDVGQVRRIRTMLNRSIYPPIQGLAITLVPPGSGHPDQEFLLSITVPPQPRELTPFAVAGVVTDDRVYGNFVGVFERREDDVTALTAPSIQAALSAGFALLRGGSSE